MTEPQKSPILTPSRMTPLERAAGRFMRAPDHGADDPPTDPPADHPVDPEPSDPPADPPAEPGNDDPPPGDDDPPPGDDKTLIGGAGDEPQEPQLPEKYELTPPEGLEINDDVLAEIDPVFRELKLDNDQANKVIALAGPFAERLFAAQNDAFQAQATDWAKEAKADSEIGGRNWAETESLVAKALDKLDAPKAFRDLLDSTKLGNHPEMIRMFRRVGALLSEDADLPRADAGAQDKADRLSTLYPEDVPKKETA